MAMIKALTIEDLAEALANGVAKDREEEKDLRRRLIHRFNDRVRELGDTGMFKSKEEEGLWWSNVDALLRMLDTSEPDGVIMRAELLRYKGDFEGCMKALDGLADPKFDWLKAAVGKACAEGARSVFVLK